MVAVLALIAAAYIGLQPVSPGPSTSGPTPSVPATSAATPATPSPGSPIPSATPSEPPPDPPPPDPYPCGEADPTCLSLPVEMTRDINVTDPVPCGAETTCQLKVDAFALPGGADVPGGADRPVVVMIPGGPLPPGNRSYLWGLARIVAGRGAVVFTADYRSSPAYGGGYPSTFGDVACAIRTARQRAPELGGDPGRVTLVAHSFGGFPGAVLALSATDYATKGEGCLATTGEGRPDAFVGIAGVYTLDRIGQEFLAGFFGGDRATAPAAWNAGDVVVLARLNGRRTPPVRLVAGTNDLVAPPATAEEFAIILRTAGFDIEVTVEDGATHDTVLYKAATVDAVLGASAAAR